MRRASTVPLVLLVLTACSAPNPPQAAALESPSAASTPNPSTIPAISGTPAGSSAPSPPTAPGPSVTSIPLPPRHGVFDYQIGGAYPPNSRVQILSRDRNDSPASGRYNICYVNAFQTQPEESDWWKRQHADLLLRTSTGAYVEDPGWPGELLLDISTAAKRTALGTILDGWFKACAAKGFQAIEPDNLDSWTRSRGLLTRAHAQEFAKLLIASAHRHGLAIAQKNTMEIGSLGFDFAIAEERAVYDECGSYQRLYGDRVIEIEYTDNPRKHYEQACQDHGGRLSVILRDRDVVAAGKSGYHYETC